ncbi:hypothetical protein N7E81_01045 [Reichenbachiella carrageenanivorans]|uniref:Cytochrome C and Quinol oxidase polypeptide I n=1 Tax=Reichenbachiella carrageenanivorans TaxID=2979869 RepID=A0ABY6D0K0_9BACT|nr:hypothetical protein [Reichenbachiella carrageenanivorans]UXX79697.1 hypothetical protein N7E81_01045 [Reichenbachiella carrageenanivorans]
MNAPIKISIIHAIMGLLTFVIFLQTGWFMKTQEVSNLPDAQRMIYRAGHIYFLFSGLLNLSIGVQLQLSAVLWKKKVQYIGSILLLLSPMIFLYGFYQEANIGQINRSITRIGIILSLAGTAFHSLVFLYDAWRKKES